MSEGPKKPSLEELERQEAELAHEVARLQAEWHQASRARDSVKANRLKKNREAVQRRQHRIQDRINEIKNQLH